MLLALALFSGTAVASAQGEWWNPDWAFRKDLSVDITGRVAADAAPLVEFPVLLRLHVGNFGYFGDTAPDGADLRFVAADGVTVLKHYVENYDPVQYVANVWVQIPRLAAGTPYAFSMYYGNPAATNGSNASGLYGIEQALVAHFDGSGAVARDATAYGHTLTAPEDLHTGAALIGGGLDFVGTQSALQGSLAPTVLTAQDGFSVSAWVRPATTEEGVLWRLANASGDFLDLVVADGAFVARSSVQSAPGEVVSSAVPQAETWQHLALVAAGDGLTFYVNGIAAGTGSLVLPEVFDALTLGSNGTTAFAGLVDELRLATAAREPVHFAAVTAIEGMGSAAVFYGEDQAEGDAGGGHNEAGYLLITLQNVTTDGWIVIGILVIMALASWIIMLVKGLVIRRVRKDNAAFLKAFYSDDLKDPAALDHPDEEIDQDHSVLDAIAGPHDHFQSSTVYHLYHAALAEVRRRTQGSTVGAQFAGTLGPEAIDSIRATVDARLVRETQSLNSMMVLLTIAIAGGPFLGLLGTVVGVMITFAAIAASGDVNVNAIAPGIAAALAATVAGLVVAIPALFGYNILATRIKEIVADMRVFNDEFVTRIAEHYC